MNPKEIGEKTEGIVLGHLMSIGCVVLLPFGNNQRYDLVVDKGNGIFVRGQCKTASYRNGCVTFMTCSTNGFTGKKRDYREQADVFWAYSKKTEKIYEVSVMEAGKRAIHLRVEAPSGGTKSNIRWAKDYEI